MKTLIRRLSRIADSSQYSPIRSDSSSNPAVPRRSRPIRAAISKAAAARRSIKTPTGSVPHGHVPLYVGDEMERFIVSAELLNHPVFIGLLNKSAQEYGYEQSGGLRVPCQVCVFERIIEDLRLGVHSLDLERVLRTCFSDEEEEEDLELEFVGYSNSV